MKIFLQFLPMLFLLLSVNIALADENEEIQHLLSFISTSDCIFLRNGNEHPPTQAREHLEMKYSHVKKRIKTAEDFIDKIASRSSLSRKQYVVNCNGVVLPTRQWLQEALASYRTSALNQQ